MSAATEMTEILRDGNEYAEELGSCPYRTAESVGEHGKSVVPSANSCKNYLKRFANLQFNLTNQPTFPM
jgi:hypothetical protein